MTKLNVKPIDDRVIVKVIKEEEKAANGLIIPEHIKKEMSEQEFRKGTVVAVGDGTKDVQMKVKVGDTVLLKEEHGDKVKIEGEFYMIFKQAYLYCIL